jgi:hypothetical protein
MAREEKKYYIADIFACKGFSAILYLQHSKSALRRSIGADAGCKGEGKRDRRVEHRRVRRDRIVAVIMQNMVIGCNSL